MWVRVYLEWMNGWKWEKQIAPSPLLNHADWGRSSRQLKKLSVSDIVLHFFLIFAIFFLFGYSFPAKHLLCFNPLYSCFSLPSFHQFKYVSFSFFFVCLPFRVFLIFPPQYASLTRTNSLLSQPFLSRFFCLFSQSISQFRILSQSVCACVFLSVPHSVSVCLSQ